MNLIHKHCGMRWPLFSFIFVRLVSGNIAAGYLITQLFLLLPTDTLNMVMFQTWRTYWIADIFVPSLIANHVVCYRARICLVGFLPFYFRISSMAKTRNGIIIYWRVRVASNFDSSTTMKQERKTRRQSLVVFPFSFFFFLRRLDDIPLLYLKLKISAYYRD
jgi:hypothetical protein